MPEVGRNVPDPRDPGTLTTMPARPISSEAKMKDSVSESAAGALAISCWNQWSYVEKKDIFGSRIYRFNVETDWCYDTGTKKLVNVDRAVGYINYETWGINFNGWQVDSHGVRSTKWSGWHDKKRTYSTALGGMSGVTPPPIPNAT
ncbi:hypothetical protein QTQ03_18195 [Micromonospora sp. WMMA1363]|uniref:hypothetical protein n=1 Tax=Micromonospora sp. WMMA1363 TaxID=3053985 RepID=UPI00259D1777|nr:hypothetical protein [Micromonospora sp. WMMA1363]MDM4721437.1 hypothetical protein [Micromonospora sp. WMMA1363]